MAKEVFSLGIVGVISNITTKCFFGSVAVADVTSHGAKKNGKLNNVQIYRNFSTFCYFTQLRRNHVKNNKSHGPSVKKVKRVFPER